MPPGLEMAVYAVSSNHSLSILRICVVSGAQVTIVHHTNHKVDVGKRHL